MARMNEPRTRHARAACCHRRHGGSGGRLGLRSAGRFGMGLLLLLSVFTGIVILGAHDR